MYPSPEAVAIFWFRRDLRLNDNHGLFKALGSGFPVLPFFLFDTEILGKLDDPADGRVTFVYNTVTGLKQQLNQAGSELLVLHGSPVQAWKRILENYRVVAVYCNHDYEPGTIQRDQDIKALLEEKGVTFYSFKDIVIFEKNEVVKDDDTPYGIFTPYSRAWKRKFSGMPVKTFPSEKLLESLSKSTVPDMPTLKETGFSSSPLIIPPSIVHRKRIAEYDKTRDYPGLNGTSRLGIHFRFGTISLRECVKDAASLNEKFLDELIWRDFYQMILFHFPRVVNTSFHPAYDHIAWRNNEEEFKCWCEGRTGYPLVDAGMRQLEQTGWMHNRVRMITASFLCKHLLIDWRWGEAWFASKLLDYELASNIGGWQWAAGGGVDAAPYFRIFNPSLQLEKFDKDRAYVRRFIPESGSPAYPEPIVDKAFARERCLRIYREALNPKNGNPG